MAETVDVAVKAAKALPCSMAMKIIIGPATYEERQADLR
jgi:hypothetical protein